MRDIRNGMVAVLLVLLVIVGGATGYLVLHYRPPGIMLGLSGDSTIPTGSDETIEVTLTNELSTTNNATYTDLRVLPHGPNFSEPAWVLYVLSVPPLCGDTPSGYIPYYVVIYNKSGSPQQLNAVQSDTTGCISTPNNRHVFSPFRVVEESISVGEFWKSSDVYEPWINATYNRFIPESYTVVAFDPWEQLAEMNFIVTVSHS